VAVFDALHEFVFFDLESNIPEVTKANKQLLTSIYYFIAKLCKNNEENQYHITKTALKAVILPHLEQITQDMDFQIYLLLKELVTQNKEILHDSEKMETIVNNLFEIIEYLDINDLRKSICFNILGEFIKVDEFCIKYNQNYITKKIFAVTNVNILPPHNSSNFLDVIKQMSENPEKMIKRSSYNNGLDNLDINPEIIIYFVTIMKV